MRTGDQSVGLGQVDRDLVHFCFTRLSGTRCSPHLADARCTPRFSSPPSSRPFQFLWLLFSQMSHQSSPLSEVDGLNHNTTNGFVKTNGTRAHYQGEDTPMSEDDDVPLVCGPNFFQFHCMRLKWLVVANSCLVSGPCYPFSEAEKGHPG